MFAHTDTKQAPWFVVEADDKRRARVNCISHLLSQVPYQDLTPDADRRCRHARTAAPTCARR